MVSLFRRVLKPAVYVYVYVLGFLSFGLFLVSIGPVPEQAVAGAGILGNFLLLAMILGSAGSREVSENLYICAKVLADALYLVAFEAEMLNIRQHSFIACIASDWALQFGRLTSDLTIIALMTERFLALMCPDEYEKWSKMSRLKVVLCYVVPIAVWQCFLMISSSQDHSVSLAFVANLPSLPKCTRVANGFRRISQSLAYMLNFFLPTLLFGLLNFLIAFKARYSPNASFVTIAQSTKRSRNSSTAAGGNAMANKHHRRWPMQSFVPLLFPLAFVLLHAPVYVLLFAYPPVDQQLFASNALVTTLKDVAEWMDLCYFSINFPLFLLAKWSADRNLLLPLFLSNLCCS